MWGFECLGVSRGFGGMDEGRRVQLGRVETEGRRGADESEGERFGCLRCEWNRPGGFTYLIDCGYVSYSASVMRML